MRGLKFLAGCLVVCAAVAAAILFTPPARGADHGDAPNGAGDQAADTGDVFAFLDPNDNTRVILALTFRGFIVPGEAANFSVFDHTALYRLEIENTGDARTDQTFDVTFSPKGAAPSDPQTATVRLPGRPRREFTAPTTVANLSATPAPPTITTDPTTGISFFAGEVDDPFFFDIPGFARFIASVRAGSPNPALLSRGRDTFAGYNILCFALSIPRDLIRGATDNNEIGVQGLSFRRQVVSVNRAGVARSRGALVQLDRSANPAVNVALIPFPRKNEYNRSNPRDDADGRFANDIVATLTALGTNATNIQTLATVAVTRGDYLRLNLATANTGPGGGDNAGAGFPNGRRLGDDTVDTLLTIINNGGDLGDSVDANDVTLRDTFPFFAPPQQPRESGVDDNTRN